MRVYYVLFVLYLKKKQLFSKLPAKVDDFLLSTPINKSTQNIWSVTWLLLDYKWKFLKKLKWQDNDCH